MCISATTKTRHVILDFDMVSEIITFEEKGKFGKEKHQNLSVKVKVVANVRQNVILKYWRFHCKIKEFMIHYIQ